MNYETLRHDKHALQFRSGEQRLPGAFTREACTLTNLNMIDALQHGSLTSEPIELRNTMTAKAACPVCPVPEHASHNQQFIEVSPDFCSASTIPRSRLMASGLIMHITISAESVTSLRHTVIGTFGEMVAFMRIQSIDHAKRMKVCLCLTVPIADRVMDAVMRALPCAEFGRITPS